MLSRVLRMRGARALAATALRGSALPAVQRGTAASLLHSVRPVGARAVPAARPLSTGAPARAAPAPKAAEPTRDHDQRENESEAAASVSPARARAAMAGFLVAAAGLGMAVWQSQRNASKCEEKSAADAEAEAAVFAAAKKEAEAESRPSRSSPAEFEDMRIFSGRANPSLANEIADNLGVELGKISIKSYADGEIGIQVNENVRGKDVYLVQPTCPPGVNDNLVELILMVSTMRRASARRITAIIPYYGYARQDRKMQARVPISAADVARLLQSMGVDRVVAVDLHCGQIQGFFGPRTPCDNLEGHVVALPYFQKLGLKGETTVVVSPDAGGVHRAKLFRDGLKGRGVDAGLAMIIKQRLRANEVGKMDLVGSVDGCDVIMVDDMIDTAGTLVAAANELKAHGAKRVFAFATHGVFSGEAYERIQKSSLERVVVCNTIPLKSGKPAEKIVQLSIGGMLSEAIARIHSNKSVSALFGTR